MNNSVKDAFDKASLINDIQERENIVREFKLYGVLNREYALFKIIELRVDGILETHTPVLTEDPDLFIDHGGEMNFLIERDNLASL